MVVNQKSAKQVRFDLNESSDMKSTESCGMSKKKSDSKSILLEAFGNYQKSPKSPSRKKRACVLCRDEGHDKRTCPLR